jgi:ferredoxin
MSGTKDLWLPFEKAWNSVLRKHGAGYLHTSEAVARKGIYKGWKVTQSDAFLRDCVRVAAKHCARSTVGDVPGKYGINCFVISFDLKDFVAHAKSHPQQPKNVYEACLRQAIPYVLQWCDEQAACDQCHCFFDQGEPFYGILKQLQENKNVLKDVWLSC